MPSDAVGSAQVVKNARVDRPEPQVLVRVLFCDLLRRLLVERRQRVADGALFRKKLIYIYTHIHTYSYIHTYAYTRMSFDTESDAYRETGYRKMHTGTATDMDTDAGVDIQMDTCTE